MPFTKSVGLSFNCGFCRGFVYEDTSNSSKTSNVSKKGSDRDDQQSVPETEGKKSIPVSDGENSQSEKVCLSAADRFRTLFGGPRLSARNFERYYETVKNAFWHGFRSVAQKEEYVKVFSSAKWKALSPDEKSRHSVSNCVACSTQALSCLNVVPQVIHGVQGCLLSSMAVEDSHECLGAFMLAS